MSDTAATIAALWSPFERQIGRGIPVYFCFSQALVSHVLAEHGLRGDRPIEAITATAQQYYEVDGDKVGLDERVFEPVVGHFSAVIALVCQQVLAVEMMVSDPEGFSEGAYFPRLREIMSPSLRRISSNPFKFDQFESVWRRLEQEVEAVQGSSVSSVTFRLGSHRGMNKARALPMGQALLSQGDLLELMTRATRRGKATVLAQLTGARLVAFAQSERAHLSRRAQSLLSVTYLHDRIIAQIRSFAATYDPRTMAAPPEPTQDRSSWELRVYPESIDWMQMQWRPSLWSPQSGEPVAEAAAIDRALHRTLAPRGYALLTLGAFAEHWELNRGEVTLDPGASFLIIGSSLGIDGACKELRSLGISLTDDLAKRQELVDAEDIWVLEAQLSQTCARGLLVRAGRPMSAAEGRVAHRYEWIGGICVDRRSQKYLKQSLPTAIRFGAEEHRIEQLERVGDHLHSFALFRESLDALCDDSSYTVTFPNQKQARISVALSQRRGPLAMGYSVSAAGEISPVLANTASSRAALVGFSEPQWPTAHPLSLGALAQLIRDLRDGRCDVIQAPQLAQVREQVTRSPVPTPVKSAVLQLLKKHQK